MSEAVDTSAEAVERLAVCADEVLADLPQQMGRASMEGHSVGQMLAAHQRGKIGHVAATLRALSAANAQLERERDALAKERADLRDAALAAKKFLVNDMEEPGRTVFWKLVAAIKKGDVEP